MLTKLGFIEDILPPQNWQKTLCSEPSISLVSAKLRQKL